MIKHLYAPWRNNYTKQKKPSQGCVFCIQQTTDNDADHFIVKRFTFCFVMLNLYPYNAGHLLVIPYEHRDSLELLAPAVCHEIMDVTIQCITILKQVLGAEGLNVGFNLGGKAAGGSIPEHIHLHIVPRWLGDTNFLATTADLKPISLDLIETYQTVRAGFKNYNSDK